MMLLVYNSTQKKLLKAFCISDLHAFCSAVCTIHYPRTMVLFSSHTLLSAKKPLEVSHLYAGPDFELAAVFVFMQLVH